MARIEERKRKNGVTSYVVKFSRNGKTSCVSFDSSYCREDAEAAARVVENVLKAEKTGEVVDRKTRLYLENMPPDIRRRFRLLVFPTRKRRRRLKTRSQRSPPKSTRRSSRRRRPFGRSFAIVCFRCSTLIPR